MTVGGVQWRPTSASMMAAGLCVSVTLLAWFGFQAVREWQRSATSLTEQRTNDVADLFTAALSRDLRGAENAVLLSWHLNVSALDEPSSEMEGLVASAFARYPYPESFFGWRGEPARSSLIFFNRAERLPPWASHANASAPFPVAVTREPVIAGELARRVLDEVKDRAELSVFEVLLSGVPYQVVVHVLYRDAFREHPAGGLGFTVNLSWVRHFYFPDLAAQIARAAGIHDGFALSILDETGASVASTRQISNERPSSRRTFPLFFADPLSMGLIRPHTLPNRQWVAQVQSVQAQSALEPFNGGRTLTFVVAAIAASALTLGLVAMARTARASAELAEIRSDFVASMTHELKTPLATIRAVGESITSGRASGTEQIREYAQIAVQESKRLTRLVENSLAYSRVADVADVYHFESLNLRLIVVEALRAFNSQLATNGFTLDLDVPGDLPAVTGDRNALNLLFDNVVDNAMRYSGHSRWVGLRARESNGKIVVSISDTGIGIPEDELDQAPVKFFRGRHGVSGGTGLGLAIVDRIVHAHHGTFAIESVVGAGTTVSVTLPIAKM